MGGDCFFFAPTSATEEHPSDDRLQHRCYSHLFLVLQTAMMKRPTDCLLGLRYIDLKKSLQIICQFYISALLSSASSSSRLSIFSNGSWHLYLISQIKLQTFGNQNRTMWTCGLWSNTISNNNQIQEAESIVKDFPNIDLISSQDVAGSS